MSYTPGQLDAVSRYLGLPQGYAPAGIPPVAAQPAAITMPSTEIVGAPVVPMPVVVPPPGASAPMPVYSPPVAVNPDADALARQLGLAPAARMPVMSPSSPIAPQSVGLQLPPGIAPAGTVPVPSMANPPPPAPVAAPAMPPPPAPVAGPPTAPPAQAYHAAPPKAAGPHEPSWADKRRADEAAYLQTFGTERTAAREANDAGAVVRDENAQASARIARLQEEQAANEASFARDESEARATYRAQTQRQVDEVREMKVDPGRLYRDANSWQGVMVGIGGALAGALSGFQGRGGENAFVDIINKNIDRDISAQVQAIGQKNASIADRNSLYGQLVASHKDDVLARAQTRVAMLESARTHMESEAQRLGSVEAQKRFEVLDAQMARTQEQANAAVHGAEEQAAARIAAARAQAAAAAAAARAAAEEKAFQRGTTLEKLRLEDKKIDLEHGTGSNKPTGPGARFVATAPGPDGSVEGYLARNPEVAQKRTNGLASAKRAMLLIDNILELRAEQGKVGRATGREQALALINPLIPSTALGTPAWKTKAEALHGDLKVETKNVKELGAITKPDEPLINSIVGDGAKNLDLFSDETGNRLRQAKESFQRAVDAEGRQEGGARVRKRVDANGRETFETLGLNAPTAPRTAPRVDANGNPVK